MAIDYSGLLTGISQDPKAQASEMLAQSAIAQDPNILAGAKYALSQAPVREAAMRQAAGGLLGRDLRSPTERARQELQQMSMSPDFNPSEPAQQKKLLELARIVNPVEAVKVASQIEQQNALRNSLIKIARAQGNTEIEEFLKAGGNPSKAAEVLFRKKSNISKAIVMTQSKLDEYDDRWEQLTDEQKVASGVMVPGRIYGNNPDPALLNQLFARAEYIYVNSPNKGGGRAAALDQAIMEASGAAPVPTSGGVAALPGGGPAAVAAAANAAAKDPFADTPDLIIGE